MSLNKLGKIMLKAQEYDIATCVHKDALYDPQVMTLNIWCTPDDNPGGLWEKLSMDAGSYTRPCELVAVVNFESPKQGGFIVKIETDAYPLLKAFPSKFSHLGKRAAMSLIDRKEEMEWARNKMKKLLEMAGVEALITSKRSANRELSVQI